MPAIAAPCIAVSGAAERMRPAAMVLFSALWLPAVYVPVVHAVGGGPGALLGDLGVIDATGAPQKRLFYWLYQRLQLHRDAAPWLPAVCATTETRHLDRLGQLSEFEQDSNTDSDSLQRRDLIRNKQLHSSITLCVATTCPLSLTLLTLCWLVQVAWRCASQLASRL